MPLRSLISGSDLRIDREGLWYYRGAEMTRRDIIRLFYRNLIRDESGRYSIKIGTQNYPVDVEDTPYVVWNVRFSGKAKNAGECIDLMLSDDRIERLDPATLTIGADNIPYCRILDGRFEARFSRSAYYALAEYIHYDPQLDCYCLLLNNSSYCIEKTITVERLNVKR
jgi:hypothetical protein